MKPVRRAVIDIGTNSVKLLVADVAGRVVQPCLETSKQTRLGRGLYATHLLQPEAIALTARAVEAFAEEAGRWQAVSTRVIATSAAREALNQGELVAAILEQARLPVEVISGEQEADWAFQGVTSDPTLANRPLLIMDVGGGSTQLIDYDGVARRGAHSFRLGAVRLLETFPPTDPPQAAQLAECRDWLRNFIERLIQPALARDWRRRPKGPRQLVGTGGSSSLLVAMQCQARRFDRHLIERTPLTHHQIHQQTERLWSLSLAARKRIPGLPALKADVILMGAAIHEAIMEAFGFETFLASTRGLRFAAVMEGDKD